MWARWVSTVRVERNSCCAISLLVWPRAISRSTSTSRSERSSGGPAGALAAGAPGGAGPLARRGGHARAEPRIQVGVARRREADRLEQFLVGRLFEDEAQGPGLQ